MAEELHCWRCGASLSALPLPLGRLEECAACRSQVHVCRMCRFYDRARPRQCREDDAEEFRDKERANFCDYFKPRSGAFDAAQVATEQAARDAADSLFGPKK
jgi:hypothetical protein